MHPLARRYEHKSVLIVVAPDQNYKLSFINYHLRYVDSVFLMKRLPMFSTCYYWLQEEFS